MSFKPLFACGILLLVAGCGTQPLATADRHIHANSAPQAAGTIPSLVRPVPLPPPPQPQPKVERYSVVVNDVPVRELLFALARDAKVNIDVHPGIEGTVTLNAIDQTLPQILTRLAKQVDMRFEMEGTNFVVEPDKPVLRTYKIDYVNIARTSDGTVSLATQVAVTGRGDTSTGGGSSGGGGSATNSSTTKVTNESKNRFWETLTANIKDLLRETDKLIPKTQTEANNAATVEHATKNLAPPNTPSATSQSTGLPPGSAGSVNQATGQSTSSTLEFREAASVIANPESGILAIRATSRQHEKVQEFLDRVIGSAKRQVLIEATIVEVTLNDAYQAGVDWGRLVNLGGGQIRLTQSLSTGNFSSTPVFKLDYTNPNASNITATISLLQQFGTTKVLSSPKIMALNNQTALLKVVDEKVYFTTDVRITEATQTTPGSRTFTTTLHTVPIGVVMSVTSQVGDNDDVSLNIRPTISRISGFVNDPTPALQGVTDVVNKIPEIQVRELESILRVPSGQTVVLGGLMQDNEKTQRDGVPVLSRLPIVGDAFSYRNDTSGKTELVIFLRPIVVREASLADTLQDYQGLLPDKKFFRREDNAAPYKEPPGK